MQTINLEMQLAQTREITTDEVARFNEFIVQGVEAWFKAGKLIVQMVEKNPNAYSIIMKDNPHLSFDVLLAFERIGRREIYPFVMLDKSPGSTKLLALPYDLQVKYYKEPVDVVTGFSNEGKPIVAQKLAKNLLPNEVKLVFGSTGIRPIEAQVLFMKSAAASKGRPSVPSQKPKLLGYFQITVDKRGVATIKPGDYKPLSSTARIILQQGASTVAIYE